MSTSQEKELESKSEQSYLKSFDSCPVCSCHNFAPYLKADEYQLVQCSRCMHIWLQLDQGSEIDIKSLYEMPNYYSEMGGSGFEDEGYVKDGLSDGLSNFYFNSRIKPIRKYATSKDVHFLDYGCSGGHTLLMVKNEVGWNVTGVDLSEVSIAKVKKNGIRGIVGGLDSLGKLGEKFDIISMFHCLEHIVNPQDFLLELRRFLKDDGLLVIEVPNIKSWPALVKEGKWKGLLLPYHIQHFSNRSLRLLLETNGFKVELCKNPFIPFSFANIFNIGRLLSWIKKIVKKNRKHLNQGEKTNSNRVEESNRSESSRGILRYIYFPFDLLMYFFGKTEVVYIIARKIDG